MWFMSAIWFSWSWILRNVDFGEKLLWFVRCVWWKDNRGMEASRGGFSPRTTTMLPTGLPTSSPPSLPFFFYTHSLCHVFKTCLCMSISVFVHRHACMQYLLLAARMYMAKYLHVSQAFWPSLVPTVRPLTHWSQPILSSYRMRQCKTWGG